MSITIDSDVLPVYSMVCCRCVHLTSMLRRRCAAFPEGVPEAIWVGDNKHKRPVEGDHGIRFEKRTGLIRRDQVE